MIFSLIPNAKEHIQHVACVYHFLHACMVSNYKNGLKYSLAYKTKQIKKVKPASVAQFDAPSNWRPGGRGFNPCRGRQHSFVEIDREIFSTVILSLLLIQEGHLSVSGERMCTLGV